MGQKLQDGEKSALNQGWSSLNFFWEPEPELRPSWAIIVPLDVRIVLEESPFRSGLREVPASNGLHDRAEGFLVYLLEASDIFRRLACDVVVVEREEVDGTTAHFPLLLPTWVVDHELDQHALCNVWHAKST